MRIIILILTAYLGGIELFQLTQVELKVYLKSYQNLNNVLMLTLNLFLMITYSYKLLDAQVISIITSLSCVHLWFNTFLWLRITERTSIYVMLIIETVRDCGWFMLMFGVCLMAFTNAIQVLNNYQNQEWLIQEMDQGNQLFEESFSVGITDALVN